MHVYLIQNVVNGKCYVGQTTQPLNSYFSKTLYKGLSGETGKPYLYNAIRKYGKNAFTIRILYTATTREELDIVEKSYIKLFGTQNRELGYNVMAGGTNGQIHAEETKQKLRDINLGKKASAETRLKMSENQKANYTEERRELAREFAISRLQTKEVRIKTSLALIGKKRPDYIKEILLKSHLGIPMTEETNLKIKAANTGKRHTPEAKEKMRQKLLAAWARRKGLEVQNAS